MGRTYEELLQAYPDLVNFRPARFEEDEPVPQEGGFNLNDYIYQKEELPEEETKGIRGFFGRKSTEEVPSGTALESPIPISPEVARQRLVQEQIAANRKMGESGGFGDVAERFTARRRMNEIERSIAANNLIGNDEKVEELVKIKKAVTKLQEEASKEDNSKFFGDLSDVVGYMYDNFVNSIPDALAGAGIGGAVGGLAGAGVGAGRGVFVGQLRNSSMQGAGMMYADLLDRGIRPDIAKQVSAGGGVVYGLIEQATALLPAPVNVAIAKPLERYISRRIAAAGVRVAAQYAARVAGEAIEEGLQEATGDATYLVAKELQGELTDDGSPLAELTGSEIFQKSLEAARQALGVSAVLGGVSVPFQAQKVKSAVAEAKELEGKLGLTDEEAQARFEKTVGHKAATPEEWKKYTDSLEDSLIKKGEIDKAEALRSQKQQAESQRQQTIEVAKQLITDFEAKGLAPEDIILDEANMQEAATKMGIQLDDTPAMMQALGIDKNTVVFHAYNKIADMFQKARKGVLTDQDIEKAIKYTADEIGGKEWIKISAKEVKALLRKELGLEETVGPTGLQAELQKIEAENAEVEAGETIAETLTGIAKESDEKRARDLEVSDAVGAVRSRLEKEEPVTSDVRAFANRIAKGEKLGTPEDIQFYQNNAKAIESELQNIANNQKTNTAKSQIAEAVRSNRSMQKTLIKQSRKAEKTDINGKKYFEYEGSVYEISKDGATGKPLMVAVQDEKVIDDFYGVQQEKIRKEAQGVEKKIAQGIAEADKELRESEVKSAVDVVRERVKAREALEAKQLKEQEQAAKASEQMALKQVAEAEKETKAKLVDVGVKRAIKEFADTDQKIPLVTYGKVLKTEYVRAFGRWHRKIDGMWVPVDAKQTKLIASLEEQWAKEEKNIGRATRLLPKELIESYKGVVVEDNESFYTKVPVKNEMRWVKTDPNGKLLRDKKGQYIFAKQDVIVRLDENDPNTKSQFKDGPERVSSVKENKFERVEIIDGNIPKVVYKKWDGTKFVVTEITHKNIRKVFSLVTDSEKIPIWSGSILVTDKSGSQLVNGEFKKINGKWYYREKNDQKVLTVPKGNTDALDSVTRQGRGMAAKSAIPKTETVKAIESMVEAKTSSEFARVIAGAKLFDAEEVLPNPPNGAIVRVDGQDYKLDIIGRRLVLVRVGGEKNNVELIHGKAGSPQNILWKRIMSKALTAWAVQNDILTKQDLGEISRVLSADEMMDDVSQKLGLGITEQGDYQKRGRIKQDSPEFEEIMSGKSIGGLPPNEVKYWAKPVTRTEDGKLTFTRPFFIAVDNVFASTKGRLIGIGLIDQKPVSYAVKLQDSGRVVILNKEQFDKRTAQKVETVEAEQEISYQRRTRGLSDEVIDKLRTTIIGGSEAVENDPQLIYYKARLDMPKKLDTIVKKFTKGLNRLRNEERIAKEVEARTMAMVREIEQITGFEQDVLWKEWIKNKLTAAEKYAKRMGTEKARMDYYIAAVRHGVNRIVQNTRAKQFNIQNAIETANVRTIQNIIETINKYTSLQLPNVPEVQMRLIKNLFTDSTKNNYAKQLLTSLEEIAAVNALRAKDGWASIGLMRQQMQSAGIARSMIAKLPSKALFTSKPNASWSAAYTIYIKAITSTPAWNVYIPQVLDAYKQMQTLKKSPPMSFDSFVEQVGLYPDVLFSMATQTLRGNGYEVNIRALNDKDTMDGVEADQKTFNDFIREISLYFYKRLVATNIGLEEGFAIQAQTEMELAWESIFGEANDREVNADAKRIYDLAQKVGKSFKASRGEKFNLADSLKRKFLTILTSQTHIDMHKTSNVFGRNTPASEEAISRLIEVKDSMDEKQTFDVMKLIRSYENPLKPFGNELEAIASVIRSNSQMGPQQQTQMVGEDVIWEDAKSTFVDRKLREIGISEEAAGDIANLINAIRQPSDDPFGGLTYGHIRILEILHTRNKARYDAIVKAKGETGLVKDLATLRERINDASIIPKKRKLLIAELNLHYTAKMQYKMKMMAYEALKKRVDAEVKSREEYASIQAQRVKDAKTQLNEIETQEAQYNREIKKIRKELSKVKYLGFDDIDTASTIISKLNKKLIATTDITAKARINQNINKANRIIALETQMADLQGRKKSAKDLVAFESAVKTDLKEEYTAPSEQLNKLVGLIKQREAYNILPRGERQAYYDELDSKIILAAKGLEQVLGIDVLDKKLIDGLQKTKDLAELASFLNGSNREGLVDKIRYSVGRVIASGSEKAFADVLDASLLSSLAKQNPAKRSELISLALAELESRIQNHTNLEQATITQIFNALPQIGEKQETPKVVQAQAKFKAEVAPNKSVKDAPVVEDWSTESFEEIFDDLRVLSEDIHHKSNVGTSRKSGEIGRYHGKMLSVEEKKELEKAGVITSDVTKQEAQRIKFRMDESPLATMQVVRDVLASKHGEEHPLVKLAEFVMSSKVSPRLVRIIGDAGLMTFGEYKIGSDTASVMLGRVDEAMLAETILHEQFHALTESLINTDTKLRNELERILEKVRESKVFSEDALETSNVFEMTAYALGNESAMKTFGKVKFGGSLMNAWKGFVNSVKRAFQRLIGQEGIITDSAFEAILNSVGTAIERADGKSFTASLREASGQSSIVRQMDKKYQSKANAIMDIIRGMGKTGQMIEAIKWDMAEEQDSILGTLESVAASGLSAEQAADRVLNVIDGVLKSAVYEMNVNEVQRKIATGKELKKGYAPIFGGLDPTVNQLADYLRVFDEYKRTIGTDARRPKTMSDVEALYVGIDTQSNEIEDVVKWINPLGKDLLNLKDQRRFHIIKAEALRGLAYNYMFDASTLVTLMYQINPKLGRIGERIHSDSVALTKHEKDKYIEELSKARLLFDGKDPHIATKIGGRSYKIKMSERMLTMIHIMQIEHVQEQLRKDGITDERLAEMKTALDKVFFQSTGTDRGTINVWQNKDEFKAQMSKEELVEVKRLTDMTREIGNKIKEKHDKMIADMKRRGLPTSKIREFNVIDFYAPLTRDMLGGGTYVTDNGHKITPDNMMAMHFLEKDRYLKGRKESTAPVIIGSVIDTLVSHIDAASRFIGQIEYQKWMQDVVLSDAGKDAIGMAHGRIKAEELIKALKARIDAMGGVVETNPSKLLKFGTSFFLRRLTRARMMGKPFLYPMLQILNVKAEYGKYFKYGLKKDQKVIDEVYKRSSMLRNRGKHYDAYEDMMARYRGEGVGNKLIGIHRWNDLADAIPQNILGYQDRDVIKRMIMMEKARMDDQWIGAKGSQEYWDALTKSVEMVVNTTQVATDPLNRSYFQLRPDFGVRTFNYMFGDRSTILNNVMRSIAEWRMATTAEEKARAGEKVASHIINSVVLQSILLASIGIVWDKTVTELAGGKEEKGDDDETAYDKISDEIFNVLGQSFDNITSIVPYNQILISPLKAAFSKDARRLYSAKQDIHLTNPAFTGLGELSEVLRSAQELRQLSENLKIAKNEKEKKQIIFKMENLMAGRDRKFWAQFGELVLGINTRLPARVFYGRKKKELSEGYKQDKERLERQEKLRRI